MNKYIVLLIKLLSFKGRASRKEYWTIFFINLAISCIIPAVLLASGLLNTVSSSIIYSLFSFLYFVITLVLGIAVFVRRLHDINKSAWWILFPYIGLPITWIMTILNTVISQTNILSGAFFFIALASIPVFLVFALVFTLRKGTPGNNKFGAVSNDFPAKYLLIIHNLDEVPEIKVKTDEQHMGIDIASQSSSNNFSDNPKNNSSLPEKKKNEAQNIAPIEKIVKQKDKGSNQFIVSSSNIFTFVQVIIFIIMIIVITLQMLEMNYYGML
jgi:uncharacterized membrane protein YhaH (DUF805 family)